MAEAKAGTVHAPIWVDLSTSDVAEAGRFYGELFGWRQDVQQDPAAGGYAMFHLGDQAVAGVGPKQDPNGPTAWAAYIGTEDADATARKVEEAGGKVVAPPFDVLDAGRMAVFQDPAGAFISVWQPKAMAGSGVIHEPNSVGWVELNSRQVETSKHFYTQVFGWETRDSPLGEGLGSYTEFLVNGESVAGAMPMAPAVPEEVPSFWMVYFMVDDLDAKVEKVRGLGGQVQMGPADYPGGRFAVLQDPQGAVFGLISA